MSDTFTAQLLTEKLTELSNTQQSIETLSAWCIFHRKKYKQIAGTWRKLFKSSSEAHKIVLLFLANDILQNSKRKGTEFISEFWKFLPGDLKSACQSNDLGVKSAITRLVGIWDERKVFGSRGLSLKEDVLGKAPPQPVNNGKSSNSVRAVRTANSVKVKVTVGGRPEKIAAAYQSVLDEDLNEDAALNTCKAVVLHMGKMEKDVDGACTQGIPRGSPLLSEVMEQESFLKQCVQQLESVEAKRGDLIAQLKEALQEQESKQELIQNQLQVAQAETERTIYMKEKIESAMMATAKQSPVFNPINSNISAETAMIIEPNAPPRPFFNPPLPLEPGISFQTPSSAPQSQMPLPLGHSVDSFSNPPHLPSELLTSYVNSTSAPPPLPSEPMPSFVSSLSSPPPLPSEPVTSFVNSSSAAPPLPLEPITSVMSSLSAPPPFPSQSATSFLNSTSAPPHQSSQQLMPFTNFSAAPPQPSLALASYTTQHQQPSPPHPTTSFSPTFSSPPPQPSQPVTSFAGLSAEEQQRKEAVAAMAAKLAASTSSAFVLSSVLSSLAAEEAASKNSGGQSPGRFTGSPPNKRAKLEKPMSVSGTGNALFNLQPPQLAQHPQVSMTVPQVSQANCQTLQPPLPLEPPPPRQAFMQTNGPTSGMTTYSFGGNPSPPVPLQVPPHLQMGQGSPAAPQPPLPPLPLPQHLQQQQQQQQQRQQQQQWQHHQQQQQPQPQQQPSNTSGFFQPPGNAFYGQVQATAPSTGAVDS